MKLIVRSSSEELADEAVGYYHALLQRKPAAVLGLATGSTPLPIYQALGQLVDSGDLSFAQAKAFVLDEYVGLPVGHPETYRNTIIREFVSRVDLPLEALTTPDITVDDPQQACDEYEEAIAAAGGIDLQLLGIGSNGHLAFNEPGSSFKSLTRLVALTDQTIADNARFFADDPESVPKYAITQGLGTIARAHELLLIATGQNKADAVRAMVEGSVSPDCPASMLQRHENATVLLDEAAASKLEA